MWIIPKRSNSSDKFRTIPNGCKKRINLHYKYPITISVQISRFHNYRDS